MIVMPIRNALKNLLELRIVLDRLAQTDTTLYEAISHDVEEAIRLTDNAIGELSKEPTPAQDMPAAT